MNRFTLAWALVGAISTFCTQSMAQCRTLSNPLHEVLTLLQKDSNAIFEKAGISPSDPKPVEVSKSEKEEFLIVPAERAGPFHLDTSLEGLRTLTPLTNVSDSVQVSYKDILPLGYEPLRTFFATPKGDLQFAFSKDSKLYEIFVKTKKYKTREGISIGSPDSSLQRVKNLKRHINQGVTFHQGEGITFISRRGKIEEIVVIRLLEK